jgi:UDP-N-acetylmuramoylalanine--D-glutamate ligase
MDVQIMPDHSSSQSPKLLDTRGLQVIVGLGKTGLSCVQYLSKQGCAVAVTDNRENPPGLEEVKAHFPAVQLSLGRFDADLCAKASRLIVSPGVSLHEPEIAQAISKGIPAIGDIELFVQGAKAPVVAITGSNGKSTVTTLLGVMAEAAGLTVKVGGNLGTPALELLGVTEPDLYIMELSSFQLETTYSLRAAAAVLLNISEDHMDRYNNIAEYLQAKQHIYTGCAIPVINHDDPVTWQGLNLTNTLSFGLNAPEGENFGLKQVGDQTYLVRGQETLVDTKTLKIKGRHQLANALAALALGQAMHFPMATMIACLHNFQGLPHRCQWVARYHGVDWYNDSKATNVGAAQAAIEGLGMENSGKLIVIAGGLGKNADFSVLCATMKKYVRLLVLIGRDAPVIAAALKGCVATKWAETLPEAVDVAYHQAQAGEAVILAPACASFDMFRSFEHRGDVFMQAVKDLV